MLLKLPRKGLWWEHLRWLSVCCLGALLQTMPGVAQEGASVVGTLHNLSVSGPGEIRAMEETQVCKFCHIPHNAVVPVPLWGHAMSKSVYRVPSVFDKGAGDRVPAPQPDGTSRLCLSCHDGTVALGDVASEGKTIQMRGVERLRSGRAGFLGTDLSGSHPVSIIIPDGDAQDASSDLDMGLHPRSAIALDRTVKLDGQSKMQCTSCHDPHADQYYKADRVPRFWVKPTVEGVCLTCHVLR